MAPEHDLAPSDGSVARIGLVFHQLYCFSFCGFLAVTLGYDLFHAANPNGAEGVLFLIFGGAALFFVLQLISAITDPIPSWYSYWLTPALRAPRTDRQRRRLFKLYAITYLAMMTVFVSGFIGFDLGLSLERISLPLGFSLLTGLLFSYLLALFRALYMFWKDKKAMSDEQGSRGSS